MFANFSYVMAAFYDSFGWGWNLLSTAVLGWNRWLIGLRHFLLL